MVADGAFLEHAARVRQPSTAPARPSWRTKLGDRRRRGAGDRLAGRAAGARGCCRSAISVFILPPSREALEQRLRDRRTDSPEVIARRLSRRGDRHVPLPASSTTWSSTTTSSRAVGDLGNIVAGQGRSPPVGPPGTRAAGPEPAILSNPLNVTILHRHTMARVTVEDCLQNVDNLFQLVLLASAARASARQRRRSRPCPGQRQADGGRAARDRRRQHHPRDAARAGAAARAAVPVNDIDGSRSRASARRSSASGD